jgi:hypothetical protein
MELRCISNHLFTRLPEEDAIVETSNLVVMYQPVRVTTLSMSAL